MSVKMHNPLIETNLAKNIYSCLVQAINKESACVPVPIYENIDNIFDILMSVFPQSIMIEDDNAVHMHPHLNLCLAFDKKCKKDIVFILEDEALVISFTSKIHSQTKQKILRILKDSFNIENVEKNFKTDLSNTWISILENIERAIPHKRKEKEIHITIDIANHDDFSIVGWPMKDLLFYFSQKAKPLQKTMPIVMRTSSTGMNRFFHFILPSPQTTHEVMSFLKSIKSYKDKN